MKSTRLGTILVVFCVLLFFSLLYSEHGRKPLEETTETTTESESDFTEEYYTYGDIDQYVNYLGNTKERGRKLARLVDPLNKTGIVDVKYIKNICEITGANPQSYLSVVGEREENATVTRAEFDEIYNNIIVSGDIYGLKRQTIYVYDIIEGGQDTIYDGVKYYKVNSKINQEYLNKLVDVYIKDDFIFKIICLNSGEYTIENVYIEAYDNKRCTFMYEDERRTLPFLGNFSNYESKQILSTKTDAVGNVASGSDATLQAENGIGFIANVVLTNNGVLEIKKHTNLQNVRVLEVTEKGIRIANLGTVPLAENFKLYDVTENVFSEKNYNIMSGHIAVKLFVNDTGVVKAGVIDDEIVCENIRVILSNNTYTGYDFSTAELTSDSEYMITYPDEHWERKNAGDITSFSPELFEDGDVITIKPEYNNGKISVNNIKRDCGIPEYYGTVYLRVVEGKFNIINELSVEKYLCNVVSDVMPEDAPDEAMCAMAICARTYAYRKIMDDSFDEYEADLDDSVACQLYGNEPDKESGISAVKNTYGIVNTYKRNVIIPMYYSSSYGVMSSNDELWDTEPYPFYQVAVENSKRDKIDLSKEKEFIDFINEARSDIIERREPYYRWRISFTGQELSKAINEHLDNHYEEYLDNILVKDEYDEFVEGDFTNLGDIISIEVVERTTSGIVKVIDINGSNKTIRVTGVNPIKSIITPRNQTIIKNDETVLNGWASLPSAYFYVEKTGNGFDVVGGGFGNGVGMSISGACCLANQGYNYKYILRYYFPYTDFMSIYDVDMASGENEE